MFAWLPWLIIIYVSAIKRLRLWKLILGGLIFALMLMIGIPNYMIFIMIIWGGVIILLIISQLKLGIKAIFAPLIIAFVIIILGTALSAVYLCSVFEGRQYTGLHIELTPEILSWVKGQTNAMLTAMIARIT